MKKTFIVMMMIMALAMSTMAMAVAQGGPHDRATGDVTWTPSVGGNAGVVFESSFNAHDGAPGAQADRGVVKTTNTSTGVTTTTKLDCVIVQGNQAWASGLNQNDKNVIFYIRDGDNKVFNQWTTDTRTCDSKWSGTSEFLDGELKVHSSTE